MEVLQQVISWLVVLVGFLGWIVFLPQIKLLFQTKEAKSISLGLVWGSFLIQVIMFLHILLQRDWHMLFALGTSLLCLILILVLIYYYRKYPGGKNAKESEE